MDQGKGTGIGKPRIETLSDLIFGLALSIGALTLIGQTAASFTQMVLFILFYGFSFIILISVWLGYTRTTSFLHFESHDLVIANIALLFLVSIEPFLFNQLIGQNVPFVENVSILYAFDLGGLFLIQGLFANFVLSDKNNPAGTLYYFKLRRNTFFISALFFFVSTLPIFWSLKLTVTSYIVIPLRVVFWLVPLLLPNIRRLWERKNKAKVLKR
jgi:uncharacterized membrane protein